MQNEQVAFIYLGLHIHMCMTTIKEIEAMDLREQWLQYIERLGGKEREEEHEIIILISKNKLK